MKPYLHCCLYLGLLLLLTTCTEEQPPAPLDRVGLDDTTSAEPYAALEVTTNGVEGILIKVGRATKGRPGYQIENFVESRSRGADFATDRTITSAELDLIAAHLDTVLTQLTSHGEIPLRTFLVVSAEYEQAGLGETLRRDLQTRYPKLTVQTLTPALETKANYLSMLGRTDVPINDFALVDIGSNHSIFSTYGYPADTEVSVTSLPYGTRSTYRIVDPLGDLTINRASQRTRIERLVRDSVDIKVKSILRQPAFTQREKVMLMGGFVYKIIRVLDIPLTGRPIDFSRGSDAELPAKFRALLEVSAPELKRGPNYSREEMFAALVLLESIMDEYNDGQSTYFFERKTWLPGLILHNVLEGTGSQEPVAQENPAATDLN
ncbi:hypothetical protein [Lewinella sp. 4G2]|uniref:hypothetical protein n=1 Tax=Lewinella sp. 4G2 TaxID=1803372 RepID=UPI0007B4A6E0|nr:hypothetical protein [Lewinella sp. 4G2]OAV44797.1 hypothetical protein A3850_009985 [Lewinella sp. 4G2]